MPSKGQSITVAYLAWDTANNVGKTGDSSNHTLKLIKDGTAASPTNSPAQVDASNAPGIYSLTLTSAEASYNTVIVCGKSSTSGVAIVPTTVTFENLPTAANAASGGLLTVGTGSGQINPDGGGAVPIAMAEATPGSPVAGTVGAALAAAAGVPNALGTPAGASLAADVAAVKSDTTRIGTNSMDSPNQQTAQTEIASVQSTVGAVQTTVSSISGTVGTNLDAKVSTRLAASAYAAPPTDYQQRAVAVTLPSPAPSGYGAPGGSGPNAVNHNTGGTDNLRYVDGSGQGVGRANVIVYLAGDWPAHPQYVQAHTTTSSDGRWVSPVYLASGTYIAVFVKPGADGPDASPAFTV